jgi:hypothetical protein
VAIRFLVRLANKEQLTPKNIDVITERANRLVRSYHTDVGNIRVSKQAIEMDLFPPNVRDAAALAHGLEAEFGEVLTLRQLDLPTPPPTSSQEVIALARSLFNDERFWETHEEVEALWKTKNGEVKQVLQGFILIAVAFVHLQRNQPDICISILRRAQKKLEVPVKTYEGLDLDLLRDRVRSILTNGEPVIFKV